MQTINPSDAPQYYDAKNRSARVGRNDSKLLLAGKEGSRHNYKLTLSTVLSEYSTPRHRHNFEQIRYPINGDYVIAKDKVIPVRWVGYVGEGVYYGPQIQKDNLLMAILQFGGASGDGYLSKRQRQDAYTALCETGEFKGGIYTWVDETGRKHNKDSYEAIWEKANNREIAYPPPRYNDSIIINPDNYTWIEQPQFPGVSLKWLATFTERETRLGFASLEPGATYAFGSPHAPEVLFVTRGSVECAGVVYPEHSAFEIEVSDAPVVPIKAVDTAELMRVQFPRFDVPEAANSH